MKRAWAWRIRAATPGCASWPPATGQPPAAATSLRWPAARRVRTRSSGLPFLAACNGTTAGGGYELALACDEIILVDDRSSAVSLPAGPLLARPPGPAGRTRVP